MHQFSKQLSEYHYLYQTPLDTLKVLP